MIAALIFTLSLQVAPIPPALPQDPGSERRAAAAALFPRQAYTPEYRHGIKMAAARLSGETLNARGANLYDRDFRLSERLADRAIATPDALIDQAIQCVAEPLAQRLSVPDLLALKSFTASVEGRDFWSFYFNNLPWIDCFNRPVRAFLAPFIEEDLAVVIAETPLK